MAAKRSNEREDVGFYAVQDNAGNTSSVPAFLMKLWALVEDPSSNHIICWDVKGKSFHIFDQARFAHELLPIYFKHNNISSFIRQLNMYGFRKVVKVEHGGLKVEHDDLEFQHMYFQQGQEELLELIKRRSTPMKIDTKTAVNVNPDDVSKVLSDVTQIKGKQDNIAATMSQLRKENEALWREVAHLRQAQIKQQRIVNKLLQFLISIANHGRGIPGLQRKRQLMINSAPESPESPSRPTPPKVPNMRLDDAGDHDYTVTSPSDFLNVASPGASTLVIQELLEPAESQIVDSLPQNTNSTNFFKTMSVPVVPSGVAVLPPVEVVSSTEAGTDLLDQALLTANILPEDSSVAVAAQPSAYLQNSATALLVSQPQQQQPPKDNQHRQQQLPTEQQQDVLLKQVALRAADKPLSSVSAAKLLTDQLGLTPASVAATPRPKDVTDQIDLLQSDIDHVRELLSSGQFSLDPSFLTGLFDPENPLSVSMDTNFLDTFTVDDLNTPAVTQPVPSGIITGQELWQYQPPENLPDLFDDLTVPKYSEDDCLPVYFDNDLNANLNIKAEELD